MGKNKSTTLRHNIFGYFNRPHLFVRSVQAEILLEDFFVAAVASVLGIRLYLHLTGFPQIGVGSLHIAHMLWGGILMLIAMVMLLSFLDRGSKTIMAVLGGIGFGAFIDELGKFITRDNDYFFQPAIALIYVIFVLIFFAIRAIGSRRLLSNQECMANAFDIARQGSLAGLDREEQSNALDFLDNCEISPVRETLRTILQNMPVTPVRGYRPLVRFHAGLDRFYKFVTHRWWFGGILVAFFAFTAVTSISAVIAAVEWSSGLILWVVTGVIILVGLASLRRGKSSHLNHIISVSIVIVAILISWTIIGNLRGLPLSIFDWARFLFPGISGVLIVIGILTLPRSRAGAYLMFRRAILVSIFFTQVLSFYEQQLIALLGLALNIMILIALRYLIAHEDIRRKSPLP